MDITTLPVEVVDEVCGFLVMPDLLSLCITNTIFSASAQRLIFRHISLNSSRTALRCLCALTSSTRLASHVRSFSLRLDHNTILFRCFLQKYCSALSMMSNLESLDIHLPPPTSWTLLASNSARYPRLTRLSCNFPLDASVSDFLRRADALTQLQLGVSASNNTPMSSPSSLYLPRLHTFIGSCEDAVYVVPGHPLQVVHLQSGVLDLGVLEALSQSSEPIEALEAFNCPLTISLLSSIASNLPRLRHLRLMGMYHSYEQHNAVPYMEVSQVLASFQNLMTAQLEGIHWSAWQKQDAAPKQSWRERPLEAVDSTPIVQRDGDFSDYLDGFHL